MSKVALPAAQLMPKKVMTVTLIENFRAAFYAPFYAGCALGAYETEGLEVNLKASVDAAQTIQSLLSGAVP